MKRAFDLYPHKCRQCGKVFEGGEEWTYKKRNSKGKFMYFCSYHCMRENEKEKSGTKMSP